MSARPLTRRQALENAAFLDALRRTGNARLAARELGLNRSTFTKRRARHAAFAAEWEMALAAAHAAFHLSGGPRPPEGTIAFPRGRGGGGAGAGKSNCPQSLRTRGGEPMIVRLANGRLQLRLAPPGRMTKAAEQAFFRALSASANIRLAAAATGFAHSSFYTRRRTRVGFARDMRRALAIGCDRLECALTERALQLLGEAPRWDSAMPDDNPLPPMTIDQCIHLVTLHAAHPRRRRPPAEETEAAAERRRGAAERARHYERTGSWRFPHEPEPPDLPPLHLVTGWSKARPEPVEGANPDRAKVTYNPDLPLFGGWRLKDWKRQAAREQCGERPGDREQRTQTAQPGRRVRAAEPD